MASNYLKRTWANTIPAGDVNQDSLYEQAADTYGSSLDRLARAYELDAEVRRDLLPEIHFRLWRSFAHFDHRCSLRTWVYRVAHNVATGHMIRQRRIRDRLVSIESIEAMEGFMPSDFPMKDPQEIWQNQPTEPLKMSASDLRRKALVRQAKVRLEALSTIIIGIIFCVVFARSFARATRCLRAWAGAC